jgi:hypothetical protein
VKDVAMSPELFIGCIFTCMLTIGCSAWWRYTQKLKASKIPINHFAGRVFPEVSDPNWKLDLFSNWNLENGNITIAAAGYDVYPNSTHLYIDGYHVETSERVFDYFWTIRQPLLDKRNQEFNNKKQQALETLKKIGD